jgi:hypothetical protein
MMVDMKITRIYYGYYIPGMSWDRVTPESTGVRKTTVEGRA